MSESVSTHDVTAQIPVSDRPLSYCERYIARLHSPYQFASSPSGGVLRAGQTVWLECTIQRTSLPCSVRGFVEGLGLLSLDPRLLKRGDGYLLVKESGSPQILIPQGMIR